MEYKEIPVVYATDENFVPYCGVSIFSLLQNADRNREYRIYILHEALSNESIQKLEGLATGYAQVTCVSILEYMPCVQIHLGQFPISVFYRILIPRILPQYDKVIYLDCDTLVLKDISALYQEEIGDAYLAAVQDIPISKRICAYEPFINHVLGMQCEEYINSGVLLINIYKVLMDNVMEKCVEFLSVEANVTFPDQDALNYTCRSKIYYLSECWNYQTTYRANQAFPENCCIIHYNGERPWINRTDIGARIYWEYVDRSPFASEVHQIYFDYIYSEISSLHIKIAIYGAGKWGQNCVKYCHSLGIVDIVAWVDKNHRDIVDTEIPVTTVDTLFETEFDRIIIAIKDSQIVSEVIDMLMEVGVPKYKIVRYCQGKYQTLRFL